MSGNIEAILSIGNLYFLLIMLAAILITYFISILLNNIIFFVENKQPSILWIFYSISGPFLMFILNAAYGIGYYYLTLPSTLKNLLEHSVNILLIINLGWLVINFIPTLLLKIVQALSFKMARIIRIFLTVFWVILIILLFYTQYIALIFGTIVATLFSLIVQKIISAPKPKLREKVVIPKKLVMTHLYISTAETHQTVSEAVNLIKEAINEIDGTGDNPHASLSAFKPGAFDILIKYDIKNVEKIGEIKEKVNLNIIKKLNDRNIKFSGHITF